MTIATAGAFSAFFSWLILYGNRYRDLFLLQIIVMCSGIVLSLEFLSLFNALSLQSARAASVTIILASGLATFFLARRSTGRAENQGEAKAILADDLCVLSYGSTEKPEMVTIFAGENFFTGPMVEHSMVFPEDTVFLTFGRNSRTQEVYEADVVRIPPINPPVEP